MEGVFKDIHRCNLTKTLIIYVRILILIWLMYCLSKTRISAPYGPLAIFASGESLLTFVKSQHNSTQINSTQLKATLKQLALEIDIVVT